jgi:hypothetical protein
VYTSEEYEELVSFKNGVSIPMDVTKQHFLRKKALYVRLKKDMDSVKLMIGTREVIPEHHLCRKRRIIHKFHDKLKHPGRDVTFDFINKRYFLIHKKDVSDYIRQCNHSTVAKVNSFLKASDHV